MTGHLKKAIWIFPLLIAGLVALLGWWGNERLHQAIADELKEDLSSTLNANVTALQIWATNQMRMATTLAEEPTVRTEAIRLLDHSAGGPLAARLANAADPLGSFLRPRLSRMGYEIAQLVDTNFIVAAVSSRLGFGAGLPVSEAHTNQFAALFASGSPVIITPFKPELPVLKRLSPRGGNFGRTNFLSFLGRGRQRRGDVMLMQVAAPVRDHAGLVRGALALVINPTNEFSRILSVARHGDSGETYAFDQTGLLISQSRHDAELRQLGLLTNDSSALNLRLHDPGVDLTRGHQPATTNLATAPLTRMVASASAGEDGVEVVPTRDYRGVLVVGAWRWLPQFGIGVVTQVEATEAFWLLHMLQVIFILLFLLLILCSVVLFIFSYASLAWQERLSAAELKLRQLGQYTLEEKIGAGSMGVVYRAHHALMRRQTAVKLLLPELADAGSVKRFEREVRLTCQLAHPNTIQIYDYGHTPDGVFYYAMELLSGLNLRELVEQFGPQPEGRVINLLTQICNSLAEAHALGLIHRDIKPSNVFLSDRGGVPDYVKVLDFGLIHDSRTSDHESDHDGLAGTPWFMAPEMIATPAATDARSDIYALGGLAYYLLTGKYIFENESVSEVLQKQLTEIPLPPSQLTANPISPELEQIILACLAKNPEDRPQSALELAAQLAQSPAANDSTPDSRAAWWLDYRRQKPEPAPAPSA